MRCWQVWPKQRSKLLMLVCTSTVVMLPLTTIHTNFLLNILTFRRSKHNTDDDEAVNVTLPNANVTMRPSVIKNVDIDVGLKLKVKFEREMRRSLPRNRPTAALKSTNHNRLSLIQRDLRDFERPHRSILTQASTMKGSVTNDRPTLPVQSEVKDYSASIQDYFQPLLSDKERVVLFETFSAIIKAFNDAAVTFWIDSGTLLGSYRHHDLIPWDDDLDLIVRAADRQQARQAIYSLGPDYRVFVESVESKTETDQADASKLATEICWRIYSAWNTSKIVSSSGQTYGFPFVDVIFFAENTTHVWAELIAWWPTMVWPKHSGRGAVFPLKHRPIGDLLVPAPCDTAGVLATEYDGIDEHGYFRFVKWCRSSSRHHRTHLGVRQAVVPCNALNNLYPFVQRRPGKNPYTIIETLVIGNQTIRSLTLQSTCS